MSATRHEVRTVMATVAIDDARVYRDRWLGRYFERSEEKRLARRGARTMAAELALKRALKVLFEQIAPGRSFTERDFVLGRRENNAPYVRRFPGVRRPPKRTLGESLHVSLSHTGVHACGLAAFAESSDNRK